jgi:4-amino-4-deoxy-L-arabinose transferase-like glycosyltransferase
LEETAKSPSGLATDWSLAGILVVLGSVYLWSYLPIGWFPWDEGSLAVAAERSLAGQLPHRDFPDLYTGGLTFINAVAFQLFGPDLLSLRLLLLGAFASWLAIVYRLGLSLLGRGPAIALALLAVVWSVPNYPAAMPSWYNLFLATAALACLIRFQDTGSWTWIVGAGLCVGVSIAIKIVGVFLMLSVSLLYLFNDFSTRRAPHKAITLLATFALGCAVAALAWLILRSAGTAGLFRFVVPFSVAWCVVALEAWRSVTQDSGGSSRLVPERAWLLLPVAVAVPIGVLALPYALSGSLLELIDGVLSRPSGRLDFATQPARPLYSIVPTLIVGCVVAARRLLPRQFRGLHIAVVAVLAVLLLRAAFVSDWAYLFVWLSAYHLTVPTLVAGFVVVAYSAAPAADRSRAFALLAVTAAVCLVEYPFSGDIYFLYTAPLVFLCLGVTVDQVLGRKESKNVLVVPWAFYAAFAVLLMNLQPPDLVSGPRSREHRWAKLALPGATLLVSESDSVVYNELYATIQRVGGGVLGYAGPDAPEVYYLAGAEQQTPVLFDFLETGSGSPVDDPGFLVDSDWIVINRAPEFSDPLSSGTMERLGREFPHSLAISDFQVRWRR